MRKWLNIICICVMCGALFSVAALNLFQTERPTYSEEENRPLESFPQFSWNSLADGKYFASWNRYISDTFYGRSFLISLSKKMELLYGVQGEVAIVDGGAKDTTEDPGIDIEITLPPITTPSVTTPPVTTPPESTTPPVSTEPPLTGVLSISFEKESYSVKQDESIEIPVTVEYINATDPAEPLTLSFSDSSVARAELKDSKITFTGLKGGSVTVTVTAQNGTAASVTVSVIPKATTGGEIDNPDDGQIDLLENGYMIYRGAVYANASFGPKTSKSYADTLALYAALFPNAKVHTLVAPLSTAMIEDDEVRRVFNDQKSIIDKVYAQMAQNVYTVDAHSKLLEHRSEYLYFKSDHHWTQLGAYYAYCAYIESVGMEPMALDQFTKQTLNTQYIGSMAGYTKDERVKSFYDTVDAYLSPKAHTMTVYTKDGSAVYRTYQNSILTGSKSYMAFLNGDQPYAVINVPENPQDKTIMVLKDSFGNAFVPYLTANYGNIIIIDPRYVQFDIYQTFKDYPIDDILFCTNIYNPNTTSWVRNCLRIVGQKIN